LRKIHPVEISMWKKNPRNVGILAYAYPRALQFIILIFAVLLSLLFHVFQNDVRVHSITQPRKPLLDGRISEISLQAEL